jgi:hypothetical protein
MRENRNPTKNLHANGLFRSYQPHNSLTRSLRDRNRDLRRFGGLTEAPVSII